MAENVLGLVLLLIYRSSISNIRLMLGGTVTACLSSLYNIVGIFLVWCLNFQIIAIFTP